MPARCESACASWLTLTWKLYLLCLNVPIQVKHGGEPRLCQVWRTLPGTASQQLCAQLSPVFAFQAVCVFARCKEAAELCSCCIPEHGEGTAGTGGMEVSSPVPPGGLCQLPITPCVGQHRWGQQPCCWGLLCASRSRWSRLMVTAEERREKMSAVMCGGAWQCCGTQHAREPQTACGMLLCWRVLVLWGALTTRILQVTSPVSHLWDSRGWCSCRVRVHSAGVRPNEGVAGGWDGPGRCTVRFTAPGYLLFK